MTYTRHRETQDTLQTLERLDIDTDKKTEEELYEKFHLEEQYLNGKLTKWQKWKPKLWALIDEPYSSIYAKVSLSKIKLHIWSTKYRSVAKMSCIPASLFVIQMFK